MDWVRRVGDQLWHLRPQSDEPEPAGTSLTAACGQRLGPVEAVETAEGAVVGPDRCAACQGLALAQQL
jgi:hypothetical protein